MSEIKSRSVPPKASAMIESLRGLGYSTSTALADIIDNCIASGAREVDIRFDWNGSNCIVYILDDGCGMDEGELESAMRLGEKSPLSTRMNHDLGRFGLGLKTASFSQCRSLTVASKKNGVVNCFRWDLDFIAQSPDHGWHLLEGARPGAEIWLACLAGKSHGTLVLWEELDRIVSEGFDYQSLLDLIDQVELHLAMVFHRFLSGKNPRLTLRINNRRVAPWDPYALDHPATWSAPIVRLGQGHAHIEVQGHVLPHKDRLNPQEQDYFGGVAGWTAQQGFYIYRNERMLVAGSWLGLGKGKPWTKEEPYRLARIRLDISNVSDEDWNIDIRKSRAKPPLFLRDQLCRLADDIRQRARRVFAHRGQDAGKSAKQPLFQAWRAEHHRNGIRYRLDTNHPAIKAVLDEAGPLLPQLIAMMRVIEETIPVQRIWLDTAESRETPQTGFTGEASAEVIGVLQVLFQNMILKKEFSPERAKEQLLKTEPFNNYPALVAELKD